MNKIEFSKLKNKENKQKAFNQLKDDYKTLYKEKDKLESNWKALKEWLDINTYKVHSEDDLKLLESVISKMNELEKENE